MKRLMKYIGPYVSFIVLAMFIKLLGAGLELMIPYLMEIILDDVVPAQQKNLIFVYGSRCPRGERPLVELYLEPGVFSERCTEKLSLRVDFIHRLELGEVSGHRVLIKRGPGNRGPTECGTTHEATSGMSS